MSKNGVGTRGAGFGLDAELARKREAQYDVNAEKKVQVWVEAVTGEAFVGNFATHLKNGQALCKLVNAIKPGAIKKIETSQMPFKQMENISAFLRAIRLIGVEEYEVFETVDLFEEKDLGNVVRCLLALSRSIQRTVPSFRGPFVEVFGTSAPPLVNTIESVSATLQQTTIASSTQPPPPPPPLAAVSATSSSSTIKITPPPISTPHASTSNVTSNVSSKTSANTPPPPLTTTTTTTNATKSANQTTSNPVGTRGGGFGLDAELARKQAEKYDPVAEEQCRLWIEAVTGESFAGCTFAQKLKNGEVLCKLINCIKPNQIAKINSSNMPFKQMENISSFLRACRALGVSEHDLFETVDLFEEKDMNVVILCIFALGRTIQVSVPQYTGPVLGPRMAVANKREFTDEQLKTNNPGETKIMAGSRGVMDRTHISTSNSVTFGADKVGLGDAGSINSLNRGSSGTMERSHVTTSNSVTFGHDMTTSK